MRNANLISKLTVGLALIMALVAFVLGSAPFTPALVLAVISLPMAIICLFFGVWRLSTIAIYWAIAAILAVPMGEFLPFGIDGMLVIFGIAGAVLSAFLYKSFVQTKPIH